MPLQLHQLASIFGRAPLVRLQRYLQPLNDAMEEAEINTRLRRAMFLAQLAHETDEFRYLEEVWGPTAQQKRYEPPSSLASKLGNTEPGDGARFKGRGAIMLTGRKGYTQAAADLGLDLVECPEIASTPNVAFRVAAWYWKNHDLNTYADRGDLEGATLVINGGMNGLDSRRRYYVVARSVLPSDTMNQFTDV